MIRDSSQRARALRIGLTGPIGCGKSTVTRWLAERPGVVAIEADLVARDVLDRGEPALDAVVARFGADLLGSDGSLDRGALGRIVFADPAALRDLEAIVHPAVRPRILAGISAAEAEGAVVVVIEAIKLVEGGLSALCDEVWLVTCDRERQRARLVGRGLVAGRGRAADGGPGGPRGAGSSDCHTDDRHVGRQAVDPSLGRLDARRRTQSGRWLHRRLTAAWATQYGALMHRRTVTTPLTTGTRGRTMQAPTDGHPTVTRAAAPQRLVPRIPQASRNPGAPAGGPS